jgi:hypothetical protein
MQSGHILNNSGGHSRSRFGVHFWNTFWSTFSFLDHVLRTFLNHVLEHIFRSLFSITFSVHILCTHSLGILWTHFCLFWSAFLDHVLVPFSGHIFSAYSLDTFSGHIFWTLCSAHFMNKFFDHALVPFSKAILFLDHIWSASSFGAIFWAHFPITFSGHFLWTHLWTQHLDRFWSTFNVIFEARFSAHFGFARICVRLFADFYILFQKKKSN